MASKNFEVFFQLTKKSESFAQNPATVLLFYLWTVSCLQSAGLRAHLSDKESELHHHLPAASPTITASAWMQICCHNIALQIFWGLVAFFFKLFKCSVISIINSRSCIYSVHWNSNTVFPFFSMKSLIYSLNSKKCLSTAPRLNHLASAWYGTP